jgi:cystathionine gamma-synthase/methionine-gamma-lyase
LAIGFGYDPTTASGAAKPPVYLTSTYVYPSAEHAKAVHAA